MLSGDHGFFIPTLYYENLMYCLYLLYFARRILKLLKFKDYYTLFDVFI